MVYERVPAAKTSKRVCCVVKNGTGATGRQMTDEVKSVRIGVFSPYLE
jgi:hypothetical protein